VFRRRTTANPSTLGIGIAENNEMKKIGRKKWSKRVRRIIKLRGPILNHDVLHVDGCYARKLIGDLSPKVRIFENMDGLASGVRLRNHNIR